MVRSKMVKLTVKLSETHFPYLSMLWPRFAPGTQLGFFLGPSVIDSSFQALMALADPDVGIGSLKIPLSIKRFTVDPGFSPCGFCIELTSS